jgi:hypothetical protein
MRSVFLAAGILTLCNCACVAGQTDAGEASHDAFVFVSAQATDFFSVEDAAADRDDAKLSAALLLTGSYAKLHSLLEGVIATDEAEIERLQIGWEPLPELVLWVGRFHQPSSYWNTEFHHGQFLQTSLTRPAIESWEDYEGPLPQHFAGVLVEYSHSLRSGAGIRAALGAGAAAALGQTSLRPSDLDDALHGHKLGLSARIDWLPDALGDTSMGVVAGHSEIALEPGAEGPAAPAVDHFDLTTFGAYIDMRWRATRGIGAIYRITSALGSDTRPDTHHLWSWYVQWERAVARDWQLYARYERTDDATHSFYFRRFAQLIERRALSGVRWDLHARHALTLEYGRVGILGAGRSNEIALQWSAVLP